jgi:hypothetical protein
MTTYYVPGNTSPRTNDTLVLNLSEDAWKGNAEFIVSVDGKQQGGPQAVTALHAAGQSQAFQFTGKFGPGTHDIVVSFINDAWGGTPQMDRNLYVNSIDYDTHQYHPTHNDALAALYRHETVYFTIGTAAPARTGDNGYAHSAGRSV